MKSHFFQKPPSINSTNSIGSLPISCWNWSWEPPCPGKGSVARVAHSTTWPTKRPWWERIELVFSRPNQSNYPEERFHFWLHIWLLGAGLVEKVVMMQMEKIQQMMMMRFAAWMLLSFAVVCSRVAITRWIAHLGEILYLNKEESCDKDHVSNVSNWNASILSIHSEFSLEFHKPKSLQMKSGLYTFIVS